MACRLIMLVSSRKAIARRKHGVQCILLGFAQVTLGFFGQHAQQVDGCPRAQNIHSGTLSLCVPAPIWIIAET